VRFQEQIDQQTINLLRRVTDLVIAGCGIGRDNSSRLSVLLPASGESNSRLPASIANSGS